MVLGLIKTNKIDIRLPFLQNGFDTDLAINDNNERNAEDGCAEIRVPTSEHTRVLPSLFLEDLKYEKESFIRKFA